MKPVKYILLCLLLISFLFSCHRTTKPKEFDIVYENNTLSVPSDVTIYYQGVNLGSSATIPDNQLVGLISDSTAYFYHTSLGNANVSEETTRKAIGCFICGGFTEDKTGKGSITKQDIELETGIRVSPGGSQSIFSNLKRRFASVDNQISPNPAYLFQRGDLIEINIFDAFLGQDLLGFCRIDCDTIQVEGEVKTYGATMRVANLMTSPIGSLAWTDVVNKNNNAINQGADPVVLAKTNIVDYLYVTFKGVEQAGGILLPSASLSYVINEFLSAGLVPTTNFLTNDDYITQQAFTEFANDTFTGFGEALIQDGLLLAGSAPALLVKEFLNAVGALYWMVEDEYISCYDIITTLPYATWTPNTVATPIFSPPAGTYTSSQSVTISCATSGAEIRYTTNGSDPIASSTLYSSPLSISSTTTLKAKAFKSGWTDSAITNAIYIIGITPNQFVYVPGGTFTMGNTLGGGGSSELPTHTVTLNSFYIGKYEVTQSEWQAVMGSNPASGYGVGDNYPVYFVSWYAILKYCNLRSITESKTPVYSINGSTNPVDWGTVPTSINPTWDAAICNWSANGYRLPTEAEWEYAARGATNNPDYLYSGSDDINAVAWYYDGNNTSLVSKPVGGKAANGLGLYDMSGNVKECCWDWFSSTYYSVSPVNNPTGPANGSYRLLRSGGWNAVASDCRVSSRDLNYNLFPFYSFYTGFRLCRSN